MGQNQRRRKLEAMGSRQGSSPLQLPGSMQKGPFCPALTTFVPTGPVSPIVLGSGQQAQQMQLQMVPVSCQGKACAWYDEANEVCGVITMIERLDDVAEKLGIVEAGDEAGETGEAPQGESSGPGLEKENPPSPGDPQ